MNSINQIIKDTEKELKQLRKRHKREESRLKEFGWTATAIRQNRGWFNLSLNSVKAKAYEEIVKLQRCSEPPTSNQSQQSSMSTTK